ncbi:MAG: RNA polymerase sigma factor FliA [Gammaproteobacteria bacterium]|nr:RNA polymerase sigma factor FliA [Gammaproteobacteria bacterium]
MDKNIKEMSQDELLKRYKNLVRSIALRTIARLPPNIHLDDLTQVGLMAVLEAAKNYDPTKGASFETYAGIRIRGSMIDEIRREDWLPRSAHRSSKLLAKANDYISDHNHKDISTSELCQHLDITEKEYNKLGSIKSNYKIFHFEDIGLEEENFLVSNDDKDIFGNIENKFLRKAIDENLEKLPLKERIVLILYYDNELSLKQIGEILSVTESRVCQLHSKAMQRLEKHLEGWQ